MLSSSDHMLEIILRQMQVRSAGPLAAAASMPTLSMMSSPAAGLQSHSSSSSFLSSTPNTPNAAQHAQSPVSLAVVGLWDMTKEYAERASEDRAKVEERLGQLVVRSLPQSLIFKSLDALFREWGVRAGLPLQNSGSRKK